MPENQRVNSRRRRRKQSSAPLVVGIVAALLVVAVAVFVALPRLHGAPQPLRPAQSAVPAQPVAAAPKPVSHAPTSSVGSNAPASANSPSSSASDADPAAAAVAAACDKADAKAAVPFPGAPAISSTTSSINHLHPRHKYIALTLDDGYNFQPALLALLKSYDIRCTTFVVGSWAAANKPDIKAMKDAGFEIANHSWSHPALTTLSSAQIASQLTRQQQVISSVTGHQAPYLRPPFGATNPHVKAVAASLGYRIVMWDRTFGDSGRGATVNKLYDNVVNAHGGIQPGDVILCHWGSKPSYEALKRIIPDLKAQGYQFVTISELVADSGPVK